VKINNNNTSVTPVLINLDNLLNEMKLSYEQFVDLCILCGSDFTKTGIKSIGPNKA